MNNQSVQSVMCDPRHTAVLMLQEILGSNVFLSEAKSRLDSQNEQDNAFVNMLLLTSLRHLVYIRRLLKQFVKKKLPSQSAYARYALILGAAEILYLDTPDYAVINSYVDLTKKQLDKYVAGFVNAVLRKICADKEKLKEADAGEFFPSEFYKILNHGYGKKTVRKIEAAALKEPFLDLSAAGDPAELARELDGHLLPGGTVRLQNRGRIERLPGFAEGRWWVQDFSAALAVKCFDSLKGTRVLDICAAPGGKTAQLLAAGAEVTALDVSAARLQTLRQNLDRLKLSAAEIICADALDYLNDFSGRPFDAILLDAPCSATGTIRRHPELVHIKTLADVDRQVALQSRILACVGKALKPGGTLVYCVCSLARAEGEEQIHNFLQNHPEFTLRPLHNKIPSELREILNPDGTVRILPHHLSDFGGADGFYIAKLEKSAR